MKRMKKILLWIMALSLTASLSSVALAKPNHSGNEDKGGDAKGKDSKTVVLSADVQTMKTLGLLIGTGKDGLSLEYTKSKPTRMQGFVIYLRLINQELKLNEFKYKDGDPNFEDHHGQSGYAKKVMAYAKAHPELNWVGSNGKFNPMAHLTAKEYAKIMLTALGYKYDTDFTWRTVESFAEAKGLNVPEGAFTIDTLAAMTVQTLYMTKAGSTQTLMDYLASINPDFAAKVALLGGTTTDQTKPTVTDLALDASGKVIIYFSEPMKSATLTSLANYYVDLDGAGTAYTSVQLSQLTGAAAAAAADGKSVTLTIPLAITGGTAAAAGVTDITVNGLTDLSGNAIDPITRFVHKENALTVTYSAAVDVYKIQVTFSNPMKSIDPGEFRLYQSDGVTLASVGTGYTLDTTGRIATITLDRSLTATAKAAASDTATAKLAIGTTNTKDVYGNVVSGPAAVPAVSAATPATVAVTDKIAPYAVALVKGSAAYTLEITFSEPVDATDQATLNAALKIWGINGAAKTAVFAFSGAGGTIRDFTKLAVTITGSTDNKYIVEILGQGIKDQAGNVVKSMAKTTFTVNTAPAA